MMSGALVAGLARVFYRARVVTTVHNAFEPHAALMFLGERVVAVSDRSRARLSRKAYFNRSGLRAVLNGTVGAVRRDYFPRQAYSLHRPNIVTLCGLHDRKGVQDLLLAFDAARTLCGDAHLYIAGDGPHRGKYEALAATLAAAEKIHFLGEIRDTRALLSEVDVFVLASHAEGLPLVIPEAREAGCAVIATAVDGIPEALDGGTAGKLVRPNCPEDIAAALAEVFATPMALELGKQRALLDRRRWSVQRVAEDYHAIYLDLLAPKRRPVVATRRVA
jgi:glycosyltransferase involved in cell wall biosynthesis